MYFSIYPSNAIRSLKVPHILACDALKSNDAHAREVTEETFVQKAKELITPLKNIRPSLQVEIQLHNPITIDFPSDSMWRLKASYFIEDPELTQPGERVRQETLEAIGFLPPKNTPTGFVIPPFKYIEDGIWEMI